VSLTSRPGPVPLTGSVSLHTAVSRAPGSRTDVPEYKTHFLHWLVYKWLKPPELRSRDTGRMESPWTLTDRHRPLLGPLRGARLLPGGR
jgi:hypothetical protein